MGIADIIGRALAKISSAGAKAAGGTNSASGVKNQKTGGANTQNANALASVKKQNENDLIQLDFKDDNSLKASSRNYKNTKTKNSTKEDKTENKESKERKPVKNSNAGTKKAANYTGTMFNTKGKQDYTIGASEKNQTTFLNSLYNKKTDDDDLKQTGENYTVIESFQGTVHEDSTVYKINDNLSIRVANENGNVQKVRDKDGNEIILISDAKDVYVYGTNCDDNLNIVVNNSEIDKIELGNGNNVVKVNDSKFTHNKDLAYTKNSIDTGNGNNEIIVKNSEFENRASINTGDGNDKVKIYDSRMELGEINTLNGDDDVYLSYTQMGFVGRNEEQTRTLHKGGEAGEKFYQENNLKDLNGDMEYGGYNDIGRINCGEGADKVVIEDSDVDHVYSDGDSDAIVLNNSNVGFIDSENVTAKDNSYIAYINTGDRDGSVNLVNSTLWKLQGKENKIGNNIYLEDSTLVNIENTNQFKNKIFAHNSYIENYNDEYTNINKTDFSKMHDIYAINNGDVKDLAEKNKISVEDAEILSDYNKDQSQTVSKSIAEKYFGENATITPEQETQAILIDMLDQSLTSMQGQFQKQDNKDGWVADQYNAVKMFLNAGITKEEIKKSLDNQEEIIKQLTDAMTGKSEKYSSFQEAYKDLMGVNYDEEKIIEYVETYNTYRIATTGMNKASEMDAKIQKAATMQDVLDVYMEYYDDKNIATLKLNEFVRKEYNQIKGEDYGNITICQECDSNGNIKYVAVLRTSSADNGISYDSDNDTLIQHDSHDYEVRCDLSKMSNCFSEKDNQGEKEDVHFNSHALLDDFKNNYKEKMGISVEDLQVQLGKEQMDAIGNHGVFQDLIDKYCQDQTDFTKGLSEKLSKVGMAVTASGALVSIVAPPVGAVLMKTGNTISIGAMFIDESLEFIDEVSCEDCDPEVLKECFKDFATDAGLFLSGKLIGSISNETHSAIGKFVSEKGFGSVVQELAGYSSEVIVDGSLSLIADKIITGDVDFSSEGVSQLMGIATGIANSKINKYAQSVKEECFNKYANDPEAAVVYMKTKGLSADTIVDIYSKVDTDDVVVNEEFVKTKTADFNDILKEQNIEINDDNIYRAISLDSKGIEVTADNIKTAQTLEAKGIEVTADSITGASKLVGADIEISDKNLKLAGSLDGEGVEVNSENMKFAGSLDGEGVEVNKYNIEAAKTLKNQGLEVTKANMLTIRPGIDVYNKIKGQLDVTTKAQVDDMVNSMVKTSGVTEQEALYSLQMLSQYSNMESLGEFADVLRTKYNIGGFDKTITVGASTALNYITSSKAQLNLPGTYYGKKAYVLDEYTLNYLEGLKAEKPSEFNDIVSDTDNVFIYPEGWNSGINMYGQQGDMASFTKQASEISTKAKEIQSSEGISYEDAFKRAMDESTTKRIEALGLNDQVKRVSLTENNKLGVKTATVDGVIDNLKPMNISQEKVDAIIDTIAEEMFSDPTKAAKAKTLITGYLESTLDVYSPQRLGTQLKETHGNIEKTISQWQKSDGSPFTMDDVCYVIPEDVKSYSYIALQYAQVNGVDSSKFIEAKSSNMLSKIPDDKIVVVLDDCVGGGSSMLNDGLRYNYTDFSNIGNRHIIMAPVTSGATGAEKIRNAIKYVGREGKDVLLIDDSQIQKPYKETDFYKGLSSSDQKMLQNILEGVGNNGWNSFGPYGLDGESGYAICFPYMAPDNDSALSSLLFESLMLNPEAGVKNRAKSSNRIAQKVYELLKNWPNDGTIS